MCVNLGCFLPLFVIELSEDGLTGWNRSEKYKVWLESVTSVYLGGCYCFISAHLGSIEPSEFIVFYVTG